MDGGCRRSSAARRRATRRGRERRRPRRRERHARSSEHVVRSDQRCRIGLAEGEPRYEDLERRLAEAPTIGVPTITLEGDANGAPHLDPSAYRSKFTGRYEHRLVKGGIGHNLPQEAPRDFARAVIDAGTM